METQSTKIREIFTSIQGEGPYVGQKQVFVRFCKCNLDCKFCDTDYSFRNANTYDIFQLFCEIEKSDAKVISFTGGEPLMDCDFIYQFLREYKLPLDKKTYLETNGILFKQLERVIDFIDVVAMDIKLHSATGQQNRYIHNEEFLKIARRKETFIKVVFDRNILQEEIEFCAKIAKKYEMPLILQPKMPMDRNLKLEEIYNKFFEINENVRLIPQVHKFLNIM